MKFISYLIWHFKKMYLIRKVLILVGIGFFTFAVYSLFNAGWAWPDYRGTWFIAASSFFVALSQFGSHLHDLKKDTSKDSSNTTT